jgi:glycosyltransferase involved in cell wall biosynthesis
VRLALLTNDWHPTGGVASHLRLVAPALAAAGHEVLVLHAGHPSDDGQSNGHPGLTVRGLLGAFRDFGRRADAAAVPRVLEALSAFGADVAHLHANTNTRVEAAVRRTLPALRTIHALDLCPSGTKFHFATGRTCHFATGPLCLPRQVSLRCTLSKRPSVIWQQYTRTRERNDVFRTHRHLVVASEYVRQLAITNGVDADRVAVIPYFTPHQPDSSPATSRTVLFVGRVTPEKGVDLMVEALRRVPGDWHLVVVGDGIGMAQLRRTIATAGLTTRVTYRGWLGGEALAAAYRDAAVVVVPSRWPEPFGIVGIEALSFGRPVVAFATGGIPEWLRDGDGGYLVPPCDVDAMATRIADLLARPDEAADMAARGRARVRREYSEIVHLDRLIPLYERVRDGGC